MCDFVLDKRDIEKRFASSAGAGGGFDGYFADALGKLDRFVADGLVQIEEDRIGVTSMGRLVIRNIAMCFDRYLDDMRRDKPIFSRTV
jgi:oxygen-independent coproporphyrinogen-3 oxidase